MFCIEYPRCTKLHCCPALPLQSQIFIVVLSTLETLRHLFANELKMTPAGSAVDTAALEADVCAGTVERSQAIIAKPQRMTIVELQNGRFT
jgi:hypothetical protein